MTTQNYSCSVTVNATPEEAFKCINEVTRWWTENLKGHSAKLNDEFSVRFGNVHYSRQRIVESIPGRKVVWLVTESTINFVKNKEEWTNTKISFEIFSDKNQTEIRFTHMGLAPDIECYRDCSNAWSQYIHGSLVSWINTGHGQPTKKEERKEDIIA